MSALFAIKGKKLGRISVLAYLSSSILNRFYDADLFGNERQGDAHERQGDAQKGRGTPMKICVA